MKKFIEQIIKKHDEKQTEKPRYSIEDLYIGQAVKPLRRGLIIYLPVREYTICVYSNKYKCFIAINEKGLPYNYHIKSAVEYSEFLTKEMNEINLDKKTKLSLKQIQLAEYDYNKNQEYDIRFN